MPTLSCQPKGDESPGFPSTARAARQACLAQILGSEDAWLTPYIVQLACKYVSEIVDDVAQWIGPAIRVPEYRR
jgi:hypothetical protein